MDHEPLPADTAAAIDLAAVLRSATVETQGLRGQEFFRALTRSLGTSLGLQYVVAGEIAGASRRRLRSLGVAIGGRTMTQQLEFEVPGTPIEAVIEVGALTVESSLRQRFAHDRRLAHIKAESYIGVAMRDADGDVLGVLAGLHDGPMPNTAAVEHALTVLAARAGAELDRRHTEEVLRASEMRYRYLVEDAFDFVAEVVDDRFVYASRAYSDVLGYDEDELLGMGTHEIIHPDDAAAVFAAAQREYLEHAAARVVSRVRCKDGSWRWLETLCRTFRAGDGVRTMVFSRDLTEIRHAEDTLRASEERFRTLLDELSVGVTLQDADAKILVANHAAGELLGLSNDQLMGLTSFDPRWKALRQDGSELPGEEHPVPQCIATGVPVRDFVMGIDRPSRGDRSWISVSVEPRVRADGSVEQVIATFHDVSERIQAEDERERFFDVSLDLMCVSGMDGYLKRVNPAFERMFGWTAEELLSTPTIDFIHPDDRTAVLGERIRLSVGEPSFSFEARFRCRDGSYRMIHWTSTADAPRKVFYATGRDVTDDAAGDVAA
jgi:PAS domain S-box-containing protein